MKVTNKSQIHHHSPYLQDVLYNIYMYVLLLSGPLHGDRGSETIWQGWSASALCIQCWWHSSGQDNREPPAKEHTLCCSLKGYYHYMPVKVPNFHRCNVYNVVGRRCIILHCISCRPSPLWKHSLMLTQLRSGSLMQPKMYVWTLCACAVTMHTYCMLHEHTPDLWSASTVLTLMIMTTWYYMLANYMYVQ